MEIQDPRKRFKQDIVHPSLINCIEVTAVLKMLRSSKQELSKH